MDNYDNLKRGRLPVGMFCARGDDRVNDRIIGQGELIACGNEFMVRITRCVSFKIQRKPDKRNNMRTI